ncbi:uncharacterized protein BDV17DRAFT_251104 [Aspergillus undulatus]|uniref:uncharacterized protein n=1 Tax=Aspergillus undulatus TaxID=1810928 RepID=UPI003CCD9CEE
MPCPALLNQVLALSLITCLSQTSQASPLSLVLSYPSAIPRPCRASSSPRISSSCHPRSICISCSSPPFPDPSCLHLDFNSPPPFVSADFPPFGGNFSADLHLLPLPFSLLGCSSTFRLPSCHM